MCAISILFDQRSKVFMSGKSDKVQQVSETFLGDKNFKWSKYDPIVKAYKDHTYTKVEKELDKFWDDLQERNEFIDDLPWDENPKLKDEMLLSREAHLNRYEALARKLNDEREEFRGRGGYVKSLLLRS